MRSPYFFQWAQHRWQRRLWLDDDDDDGGGGGGVGVGVDGDPADEEDEAPPVGPQAYHWTELVTAFQEHS